MNQIDDMPSQPNIDELLLTPFFNQIDENSTSILAQDEELIANYTSYDLFCLKTRLLLFLKEDEMVQFKKVLLNNRMVVTIKILDGSIERNLTPNEKEQLKGYINEITEEIIISNGRKERSYCLLYYYNTSINIPEEYQQLILPYLEIETDTAKIKIRNSQVFASIPETYNFKNYQEIYEELNIKIVTMLKNAYKEGYIPCDQNFKGNWELVQVNKNTCKPNWNYPSFIPDKSKFLFDRYNNFKINIRIPDNQSFYHLVAKHINPVTFISGYLQFLPNNINEVRQIYTLVEYLKTQDYSFKVSINRLPYKPKKIPENCVIYTLNEGLFPVVISTK